ncbi:hypothetical protein V2A60_009380 [Cordyceps javanica]
MPDAATAKARGKALPSLRRELMRAQVDRYFCRRNGAYEFSNVPLAICETQPFVLWETPKKMQSFGRKQQRWPAGLRNITKILRAYLEYGTKCELYITGQIGLSAIAPVAPPGFDAEANQAAASGSGSYNAQVERTNVDMLRVA